MNETKGNWVLLVNINSSHNKGIKLYLHEAIFSCVATL